MKTRAFLLLAVIGCEQRALCDDAWIWTWRWPRVVAPHSRIELDTTIKVESAYDRRAARR